MCLIFLWGICLYHYARIERIFIRSFANAQDLFGLAEMAKARYRGVSLRDIMEEFTVNKRTARRMARALENVFPRFDVVTDDERCRWGALRDVAYIRHRGFCDSEIAALDLAIRRAERDGATVVSRRWWKFEGGVISG